MLRPAILVASLAAAATFGLIDTFNFVFVEDSLSSLWRRLGVTSQQTLDILNAGVSSAISIMVAVIVENFISRFVETRRSASLDAIGVIIGTVVALAIIKLSHLVEYDRTWIKTAALKRTGGPILPTLKPTAKAA